MSQRFLYGCGFLMLFMIWMFYRARRRKDYPQIPLAAALNHMKTGDLVLMSGRYLQIGFPDQMLRRALFLGVTYAYRSLDATEWSHVAVVYRPTCKTGPWAGKVFLLHAEMDTLPCDLAGQPATGVQMTEVETKLRHYLGYYVWRPINRELPENQVLEFLRLTYSLSYRIPGDVWIRFMDRILKARRSKLASEPDYYRTADGVFCSEWVGAFYEFCGVFDRNSAPYKNYYSPSDFSYKGCNRYLNHQQDYRFDNDGWEIILPADN